MCIFFSSVKSNILNPNKQSYKTTIVWLLKIWLSSIQNKSYIISAREFGNFWRLSVKINADPGSAFKTIMLWTCLCFFQIHHDLRQYPRIVPSFNLEGAAFKFMWTQKSCYVVLLSIGTRTWLSWKQCIVTINYTCKLNIFQAWESTNCLNILLITSQHDDRSAILCHALASSNGN